MVTRLRPLSWSLHFLVSEGSFAGANSSAAIAPTTYVNCHPSLSWEDTFAVWACVLEAAGSRTDAAMDISIPKTKAMHTHKRVAVSV